jgi:hypothetical protein
MIGMLVWLAVTMVRQDNAISANHDVSLADGNIKIKAHPSFYVHQSVLVLRNPTQEELVQSMPFQD